jgi:hypothetical protein
MVVEENLKVPTNTRAFEPDFSIPHQHMIRSSNI